MLGKTNACVGSEGIDGAILTAVNKTNATINKGDKVWLNDNARVGDVGFKIAPTETSSYGFVYRSGDKAWCKSKEYALGKDSSTLLGTLSVEPRILKYGDDNSIFSIASTSSCARCDDETNYKISACYMNENFFSTSGRFFQADLSTGLVTKEYDVSSLDSNEVAHFGIWGIKIGDYIYSFASSSNFRNIYRITDTAIEKVKSFDFGQTSRSFCPLGITTDNRYIICVNLGEYTTITGFYDGNAQSSLRIVEYIDENTLRVLSQTEMPADLQEFYDKGYVSFNPYTGVVCACKQGTQEYAIVKYENGNWIKVPTDIYKAFSDDTWQFESAGITVSDDLNRLGLTCGTVYTHPMYAINLTTTSGYAAVPYRFYSINENSVTGIANNTAEVDGNVEVNTLPALNQDLEVKTNGVYEADEGYTGLGTVTVNVAKYGVSLDDMIGNVNENGDLQPLTDRNIILDFTGVKRVINGGLNSVFMSNRNIVGALFPDLEVVGANGMRYAFNESYLEGVITFPKLHTISNNSLQTCFRATKITSISFPALTSVTASSFATAFTSCTSLTEIHFRADMQATIETLTGYDIKWGATNATIYFDL